jgi:outer membrane protein OmpA-like peptidoglycan-associated protein
MGESYKKTGKTKIALEREILKRRNADFPDLTYNAGLYSFAGGSKKALEPLYPMRPYNKAEFDKAIGQLPEPGGMTPLQSALAELEPILSPLKGHTVVFVVTDGTYTKEDYFAKPLAIAKDLYSKYDVSFFVIDSSGIPNNVDLNVAVNSISPRSRVISYDQFIENPLFLSGALFVIEKRMVKKSKDIVTVIGANLDDLLFAFDSAAINPKYFDKLNKLGEYMQSNPKAKLALSAFTDNKGFSDYNLDLSRRRVESIAGYLETNFKIARERMILNFYGEANPVAGNDTDEGRAQNRRIEGFIFEM